MAEVQELKKHGALAKSLETKLTVALQNLNKQSENLGAKLTALEEKLQQSEKEIEINTLFSETQKLRSELLSTLIKKDKAQTLLQRNKERLSMISLEIELSEEVIGEALKPALNEVKSAELEVNEFTLGLNENEEQIINLNGGLLTLTGGEIDFSNSNNQELLKAMSYEDLNRLLYRFPKLAKSLPVKMLFGSVFRVNVLKAIASYVFEEIKIKTITEINNNLGELLCFDFEIPNDFEQYMSGIINLFKVKIKQYLVSLNADQSAGISSKLICDEHSRLLPEEYYRQPADTKKTGDTTDVDIDAEIDAFLASLGN